MRSGNTVSIATDGSGHVGVVYQNAELAEVDFRYFNGSSWGAVQKVDDDPGIYMSLGWDGSHFQTSYYSSKSTLRDLRLATLSGSTWSFQTIDSSGDVGRSTSLAIYAGKIGIAYEYTDTTNHNSQMRYATPGLISGWDKQTVDLDTTDGGGNTSLAFDSLGSPAVSYYIANQAARLAPV